MTREQRITEVLRTALIDQNGFITRSGGIYMGSSGVVDVDKLTQVLAAELWLVIETVAEAADLPVGTVVRDECGGFVWEKYEDAPQWQTIGMSQDFDAPYFPARVIYRPDWSEKCIPTTGMSCPSTTRSSTRSPIACAARRLTL